MWPRNGTSQEVPKICPVQVSSLVLAQPKNSRKRKPIVCKDDETTKFPTVSRELLVEEMEAAKRHGIPRSYLCDPDAEWIDKTQGRVQFGSPAHFKALKTQKDGQSDQSARASSSGPSTRACGDMSFKKAPIKLPDEFFF